MSDQEFYLEVANTGSYEDKLSILEKVDELGSEVLQVLVTDSDPDIALTAMTELDQRGIPYDE